MMSQTGGSCREWVSSPGTDSHLKLGNPLSTIYTTIEYDVWIVTSIEKMQKVNNSPLFVTPHLYLQSMWNTMAIVCTLAEKKQKKDTHPPTHTRHTKEQDTWCHAMKLGNGGLEAYVCTWVCTWYVHMCSTCMYMLCRTTTTLIYTE